MEGSTQRSDNGTEQALIGIPLALALIFMIVALLLLAT